MCCDGSWPSRSSPSCDDAEMDLQHTPREDGAAGRAALVGLVVHAGKADRDSIVAVGQAMRGGAQVAGCSRYGRRQLTQSNGFGAVRTEVEAELARIGLGEVVEPQQLVQGRYRLD